MRHQRVMKKFGRSTAHRKAMMKNAIDREVRFMHIVINEKQYRKFLLLLNVTLNNRGLNG